MALSRISRSNLLTPFNRNLQPVGITSYSINEIFQLKRREMVPSRNQMKILHVTNIRRYPDAPTIPLPNNVSEIFANETGRFTPERARDIASPILIYGANKVTANNSLTFSSFSDKKETFNGQRNSFIREDMHVDSYDCTGTVSLNGSMQSNVPKPFCSTGKSTHFNMPGGQWAKDSKYIAEDIQKSNYKLSSTNILSSNRVKNGITNEAILMSILDNKLLNPIYINRMRYSTNASTKTNTTNSQDEIKKKIIQNKITQSRKEKFKIIVRDYGKVVIVFHIAISLASLGFFYTAIVSGIDLMPYIETFYNTKNEKVAQVLSSSSGFILAYTIHKIFAPIRLSITCGVTPWLVLYLRKKGILKPPKPKQTG